MKQYLDLVRSVLSKGTRKPNRTGVDTISTFNENYEIDLREGFPLLTTKEISWKNIVVENLWFLSGETHIGLLKKHGCKFWDPWADADGPRAERVRQLLAALSRARGRRGRDRARRVQRPDSLGGRRDSSATP